MTPRQRLEEIQHRLTQWEDEHYLDRSDGWISSDIPFLLAYAQSLEAEVKALRDVCDYVQSVHIEEIGRAIPGKDLAQWALEHNAAYARKALAKADQIAKEREKL